jgi:TolA-binding protein
MIKYRTSTAIALGLVATAFAPGAFAQQAASPDAATIQALERQLHDLQVQIDDLKRSQSAQVANAQVERTQDVQVTVAKGRPTFKSADGGTSLAIRSLVQFDSA